LIFISTGSRKFQFDRLIKKVDELAASGAITEEVFAQIAETTYVPQHIKYERYLSPEDFKKYQTEADLIISHAGTGALVGALKLGKQVLAIPRLAKYNEHSDDHQMQVADALAEEGFLRVVYDMEKLEEAINLSKTDPIVKKYDKPSNVVNIINDFLSTF